MIYKIFCKHNYKRIRLVRYDDGLSSWDKSIWKCDICGKVKYSRHPYKLV